MDARELIDRAATTQGLSHAKLAKAVGVTPASLSNLRNGKAELSDDTYAQLATLAGVDPALIIIEKHERKAGKHSRQVWQRLRAALRSTDLAVALFAVGLLYLEVTGKTASGGAQGVFLTIGIMRH